MIHRVHETSRQLVVASVLSGALVVAVAIGWQVGVFARPAGNTESVLVKAIEMAQSSDGAGDAGGLDVSLSIQNVGSRKLITVATFDAVGHCMLARSTEPGFVEFAGVHARTCTADLGSNAELDWSLDTQVVWSDLDDHTKSQQR